MINPENSYQNPEAFQENPLITRDQVQNNSSQPPKGKFVIPADPRFKILLILAVIIIALLPLSLISFLLRRQPAVTVRTVPTSTISPSVIPTSAITIPSEIQAKIDGIQKLNQSPDTILPPQIDEEIGVIKE